MADKANLSSLGGRHDRIMRTVYYTLCIGDVVDTGGVAHPYQDTLIGKYTPKRATAFFRRVNGDDSVRILRCEIYRQLVSMSFEDFWLASEASKDPELYNTITV